MKRQFGRLGSRFSVSLSTSNYMLGGRSRTVAGMVVAAVLFGGLAAGTMPVLRDRLSPDEALVLADMADGRVRASTIQVATRALFSHEFGNFHAALWLGHAVREGLASEDEVRAAFRSYLCDSPRSGRPCNFVLNIIRVDLEFRRRGRRKVPCALTTARISSVATPFANCARPLTIR